MGIHTFPILEGHTEDIAEARRDMWLWAEPVIVDCAAEIYERTLANQMASHIMAKKHCRLWQAVIYDQLDTIPALADDLRRTSEKFGLKNVLEQEVNSILLEELVDIVLSRFRTSRRTAKACSMVLMSATSTLGAGRAAA